MRWRPYPTALWPENHLSEHSGALGLQPRHERGRSRIYNASMVPVITSATQPRGHNPHTLSSCGRVGCGARQLAGEAQGTPCRFVGSAMKRDAKLCRECHKRKALFFTGDAGRRGHGRMKTDRYHDLCRECQRALRNTMRDHHNTARVRRDNGLSNRYEFTWKRGLRHA